MKSITRTVTINKPTVEVFAFVLDPANTPKWVDGVVREETNEWPVRLGTIYRNQNRAGEWSEYSVIALEPNKTFSLSKSDGSQMHYRLTPIGASTTELAYEWISNNPDESFLETMLTKLRQALDVTSMTAKRIIVYSHGFGVRKDDRGLFTDIAASLPECEHVMFDYGIFDETNNALTIPSLHEQADKLKKAIANVRSQNPDATIDLVCHSQGCIVASLVKPETIRKFVLTGPPAALNVNRMLDLFANRPGSEVNLSGISRLKRADFSMTNVLPEYWKSLENINPISLYNELAKIAPTTLVNATKDEIIGSLDFSGISPEIKVVEIETGHNFEGEGRQRLLDLVAEELRDA